MNIKNLTLILITLSTSLFSSCMRNNDFQRKVNLNPYWHFHLGDLPGSVPGEIDPSDWQKIDLPHDWAIEEKIHQDNSGGTANGFFAGGIGWYRKSLDIPESYRDKAVYLLFEGIYMDSEIWLNGKKVGGKFNGYVPQLYEINEYLNFGESNTLTVRVNNADQPTDRWYHGNGIYRDVFLLVAGKVHIKPFGSYIRATGISKEQASLKLDMKILNGTGENKEVKVITHIYHPIRGRVAVTNSGLMQIEEKIDIEQILTVDNPDLWSPGNPVVYEAVTDILSKNNSILDTYVTPFGIRDIKFDPDLGFVLNGEKVMLKGVCIHHDLGVTGAEFYPSLMERRLRVLKECGVNALRLAHNPHEPELLDMCDSLGFIVINELFDKWETEFEDYARDDKPFRDTWKEDLQSFVKRDRNHPSVVLWSAGNETMEQLMDPERGVEILESLYAEFRDLDQEREVTCAMHPHGEDPSRLIHLSDVVSYNYRVEDFEKWRKEFPGYTFIGSETKVYREGHLENWGKPDFSKNTWFMLDSADAGQFIWAGIDYLGESRGWPDKGIRTGFITTTGFIKPYGQFQKSIYSEEPMIHITVVDDSLVNYLETLNTWQILWYGPPLAEHWNFTKDSADLIIFTNQGEVEILLNGQSVSTLSSLDYPDGVIKKRIAYTPGQITARSTSDPTLSHSLQTHGKPVVLKAELLKYPGSFQKDSLIQVIVSAHDQKGVPCRVSGIRVCGDSTGPLEFIGADNGDMADHTLYSEPNRKLIDGKCLFVFRLRNEVEPGEIIFNSEGLNPASLMINQN